MKYRVYHVLYGLEFESAPCSETVAEIVLNKLDDFRIPGHKVQIDDEGEGSNDE
jgi:hypothetical protein